MVSDINLLPEDQRAKEQRELNRRDSARPGVTYSQPAPLTPPRPGPAAVPAAKPLNGSGTKILGNHASQPLSSSGKLVEEPTLPPVVTPRPISSPALPVAAAKTTDKKPLVPPPLDLKSASLFTKWGEQLGQFWKKLSRNPKMDAAEPTAVEVNLIPEETTMAPKGQLWLLVSLVLAAAVIVTGSFLLLGASLSAKQQHSLEITSQLTDLSQQIQQQQSWVAELTVANGQVKIAQQLLADHVYWTNFFRWLESVTLPNVYYSGFMGDVAGKFNLSASARDYTTLAQQLLLLQSTDQVTQVSVSEASRDSDGWVNFTMSLAVKPGLFMAVSQ